MFEILPLTITANSIVLDIVNCCLLFIWNLWLEFWDFRFVHVRSLSFHFNIAAKKIVLAEGSNVGCCKDTKSRVGPANGGVAKFNGGVAKSGFL